MLKKLSLVIISLLILPFPVKADDEQKLAEANTNVNRLVELLNDSYSAENRDIRKIKTLQLGKKHDAIVTAIFTIGGFLKINKYTQYLVVFDSLNNLTKYESNWSGKRNINRLHLIDVMRVGGN